MRTPRPRRFVSHERVAGAALGAALLLEDARMVVPEALLRAQALRLEPVHRLEIGAREITRRRRRHAGF
jgi:hypothetical protein